MGEGKILNRLQSRENNVLDYLQSLDLQTLENLYYHLEGFETKPVDIETFVTDPYYLGNYFEGEFRSFWMDILKRIYPDPLQPSPYWLVILRGAIGLGKTTTACVGTVYDCYRLLCLRNPQRYLGVISSTKLTFAILNMTLTLADDVVWGKLSKMFSLSPFFSSLLGKKKVRDSFFPKNIDFTIGSRIGHTLGRDIIGGIIDEANFEVIKGQVLKVFRSLLRRIQSRFMKGGNIPGKIWIVSSEGDKGSVLNNLVNSYKRRQGVLEVGASLWDVVPEKYSGKTFKVFIGTEEREPEIITEQSKDLLERYLEEIIDVPIEHYDDFKTDINSALKDLAGVSAVSSTKLFRLRSKLRESMSVTSIFPDEIQLDFDDKTDQVWNYLKYPDYFKNFIHREVPRCIHIDIGLSGDRLGIAAGFISGFKERVTRDPFNFSETAEIVPEVIVEWCLGIKAKPGQQIPLYKVRIFIDWLTKFGYRIDRITCDGFQSADMLQWAKTQGFKSEIFSLDRTSLPYLQFRTAVYEGRVFIPENKILKKELEELELTPNGNKVDHPEEFEDGTKGSKDIADAVAGCFGVANQYAEEYKMVFFLKGAEDIESVSEDLKEMFWGVQ